MSVNDVPLLGEVVYAATSVVGVPYRVLRVPQLRLKLPRIPDIGPMTVFAFLFLSYFVVTAGVIYDLIVEPPSIGSAQDPVTGQVKPVAFLQYRINGQYIIEGLSAAFLFCLGGIGFMLLDWSNSKRTSRTNRLLLLATGALCVIIAYNLEIVFIRFKVPGYLSSD